jgi:Mrp family chromosome partitioning ATPase
VEAAVVPAVEAAIEAVVAPLAEPAVEPPGELAEESVVEAAVESAVELNTESAVPAAAATETLAQVEDVPCGQPSETHAESPVAGAEEFSAGLQVDHFAWPKACCRLITAAHEELDHLAVELKQLAGRGRVVAVASPSRGAGATTVLLCVAQRLALAGIGTVAVDGDLSHPQLGETLGLKPECGWEEVLAGRESLDEVLIESVDDRMAVLPLVKPVPPSRELPGRVTQSLATLCSHYETVLWNMGPADDWWVLGDLVDRRLAEQIGLLLVVADSRQSDDQLQRICRKATAAGIEQIVLVENFAGPQPSAA